MPTSLSHSSKAAATRDRILEVAAALFWRRSFHAVAMDELAEEAKVNKATIYRYFADKADLAMSVARLNGSQVEANIFVPAFEHHATAEDRLAAIYRCMTARLVQLHAAEGDVYGCPMAGLVLELGQEMPELRAETADIFGRIESHFRRIATQAIEEGAVEGWTSEALGSTLLQILHGAFVSSRLSSSPAPFFRSANASLALIGSDRRIDDPSGEHQ